MSDIRVFDRTIQLLQDRLTLNSRNQQIISGNLANLNTPNYSAKSLSFDRVLQESLEEGAVQFTTTHARHLDPGNPAAALANAEVVETGAVDLEGEMMKLSKNSIEYQYITAMLNKKFSTLRHAIGEGGL